MKFHILALATALTFGGAAFAAQNDAAKAPVAAKTSTHTAKMKHRVTKHANRHTNKKHHAKHMAKRHHMNQGTASLKTDVDTGNRQDRMDAALKKFRTHS